MENLLCVLIILIIIYFIYVKWASPECASCKTESMIAANTIARMSRGYNGMNTGGSYADAMNQLHEAEVMSLSSVEGDLQHN
jgi:hypothetical protein